VSLHLEPMIGIHMMTKICIYLDVEDHRKQRSPP
jgi:hypothetical protein